MLRTFTCPNCNYVREVSPNIKRLHVDCPRCGKMVYWDRTLPTRRGVLKEAKGLITRLNERKAERKHDGDQID